MAQGSQERSNSGTCRRRWLE